MKLRKRLLLEASRLRCFGKLTTPALALSREGDVSEIGFVDNRFVIVA